MASRDIITCLVWLEWPEKCFRVDAKALRFLATLLPRDSRIIRAKSERAFLRDLPKATHVITWEFREEWFAIARDLRVLATPGAGRELVAWKNAPRDVAIHFGGFHGAIISESVAGFILSWAHGFFHPSLRDANLSRQAWRKTWPRVAISDSCFCVANTRAVIAGYGKIGKAIGEKLSRLGVAIKGFGRDNREDFLSAVRDAHWLILALPSDTGTDNFLDKKLLAMLSRHCVVINIGRGNAIDEKALIAALKAKKIAGAYLDVFSREPGLLAKVASGENSNDILGFKPSELPENLIKMPHSSAFSNRYLEMCFEELKNDGII